MIQQQKLHIGSRVFVRSYSDIGHTIRQDQTGIEYNSAIDLEDSGVTYTETDHEIVYEMPTFDD